MSMIREHLGHLETSVTLLGSTGISYKHSVMFHAWIGPQGIEADLNKIEVQDTEYEHTRLATDYSKYDMDIIIQAVVNRIKIEIN